jgi:hypothetical protein
MITEPDLPESGVRLVTHCMLCHSSDHPEGKSADMRMVWWVWCGRGQSSPNQMECVCVGGRAREEVTA